MAGNRDGAIKAAATVRRNREQRATAGFRDDGALGPRQAVPITDSGAIAWDELPADQRDKLLAGAPAPAPAGSASPAPADALAFDAAILGWLYVAISSVGVSIARANGARPDVAELARFNAEEKAALVPLTERVLAKYAAVLGKYQDEAALAMALFAIVSAKVTTIRATILQFPTGERVDPAVFTPGRPS